MANEEFFESFLRNSSNYNGQLEFYEDTHDERGNYVGHRGGSASNGGVNYTPPPTPTVSGNFVSAKSPMQPPYTPTSMAAQRTEQSLSNPTQFGKVQMSGVSAQQAKPLPTTDQYISPQLNQNFVVYRPRSTTDVEQLIAYLRRREPALVDLDPIADSPEAQRLMDFTSGAAYALGDRVMMIRRNLFLITPDTIDVLKPETDDR